MQPPNPISMTLHDLGDIELFADLDAEELSCEIRGETVHYRAGEVMWQEGDEARAFMLVLEGEFEIYRNIKGERLHISIFRKGMSGGELPLLAGTPHPGNARALTDVTLFRIGEQDFWQLLADCGAVRRKILRNMAERLQEINQLSYQREKLISLGTMAAGLAHELNNPASAARRASQRLRSTLDEFDQHSSSMLKNFIFKPGIDVSGYPFQPLLDNRRLENFQLDSLDRSDKEDDLIGWLEERGIDDPFDMASAFVEVGYNKHLLASFSEKLLPDQVDNFLRWVHKETEMLRLAQDLQESTSRLQALVTAVKEYSYMDQGSQVQDVDLHRSLDNTILVLKHKWKHKNIQLIRDYSPGLPPIQAYGGELNQVWTNLIDNAIDAVPEKDGRITVRTFQDFTCTTTPTVAVGIQDNGTGIPEEIRNRIFDPFFTTKEPGKGTGIGLEISHRIVVGQHKGSIEVESAPGNTRFTVYLPVSLS